jgi:hypothetical protein
VGADDAPGAAKPVQAPSQDKASTAPIQASGETGVGGDVAAERVVVGAGM